MSTLTYEAPGVQNWLPAFTDRALARLRPRLAWQEGRYASFDAWRREARAKAMDCLLDPPPDAPFDPAVLAERDMGTHISRKVVLNISGFSRVLGYLLVPAGSGPFPAVLLLHDHGARFDIGKEKVVRPWDVSKERVASSQEWIATCYGGRYIGEELARRGYVCFVTDALNWSDRGEAGYEGQQALNSNLLNMGMSLAGLIAHEDLRAAAFLASLPEVDPQRVAAMGLSMGSFRSWQVAGLSDHIRAAVCICWMAARRGLLYPGANMARGNSAYTLTHPGLCSWLDHPDVARLACPKPMLFYNGLQDGLFPVPAVEEAYDKMRSVWASQGAADRFEARLWDVPHEFNAEMQEEAFAWLDRQFATD
ncbi:MAG: hydrolase [Chloroflexi bacterium]|nr:hydrolase [Chloroflexota bacterium]